jgi:uncharacterized protein YmfQ (DUF2313 family)
MNTFFHKMKWAVCLAGTLALTAPAVVGAATDSSERWHEGQADLQKNLPPGQSVDVYRKKLDELGYKVTSTNYNNPDYVEYEIVKGDQTWEVQIDVDENTHKATKVEVASNMWKTDATKQALAHATPAAENSSTYSENRRTALRNNEYSDRDRTTTDQLVKELEALPVGHDKQYYKETLRQRGYDIARIDKDSSDELKMEAVKNGHSVKMDVSFNEDTGKSTKVDASSLWAESESTTRTREAQMEDTTQAVPERRSSTR